MPNYSWSTGKALPEVSNGHSFEMCNFHQKSPHTPIFTNKAGLVFKRCNLINCDVPPDAIQEECINIHVDCCSHLHPEWTAIGQCAENCRHVVYTDEITIDDVIIQTVYHYADARVD